MGSLPTMRVLVVGGGGREHALCLALRRDPTVTDLWCAPGNAGTATVATNLPVDPVSGAQVAALAARLSVDLVVVGPEAPLVAGVVDAVRAEGIACFGPSARAARLEGSKAFAKDVMQRANVPTARAVTCSSPAEVRSALEGFGSPYVVKDDALAAGKGVVVTDDLAIAVDHAAACRTVVIEEFLDGPEVSLFVVADGTDAVPLLPAQDFKRVSDGDQGPNTGGMGAYAPLHWLPEGFVDDVMERVVHPTLRELNDRGTPFSGLLYVGLALTSNGPKVVEFNVRFGDPETEVVLPLLESSLGGLLMSAAQGRLASHPLLRWSDQAACTVVIASAGYPGQPRVGEVITGIADAETVADVTVLHAGTRRDDGDVVSCGGRVLAVTATGETLTQARDRVYTAVAKIHLAGAHFRTDIAATAVD